jgi:hypothetical protein
VERRRPHPAVVLAGSSAAFARFRGLSSSQACRTRSAAVSFTHSRPTWLSASRCREPRDRPGRRRRPGAGWGRSAVARAVARCEPARGPALPGGPPRVRDLRWAMTDATRSGADPNLDQARVDAVRRSVRGRRDREASRRPVAPGSRVEPGVGDPGLGQAQQRDARRDAGTAIRDHRARVVQEPVRKR